MQNLTQIQDILFETLDSYGGLKEICIGYQTLASLLEQAELPSHEGVAFILTVLTDRLSDHLDKLESLLENSLPKKPSEYLRD